MPEIPRRLTGILEAVGYEMTEEENADFVVYNTCTVRENANHESIRPVWASGTVMKKKNPHMMIALCGCMMQEADR